MDSNTRHSHIGAAGSIAGVVLDADTEAKEGWCDGRSRHARSYWHWSVQEATSSERAVTRGSHGCGSAKKDGREKLERDHRRDEASNLKLGVKGGGSETTDGQFMNHAKIL
jgi:hypothetical protein